MTTVDPAQNAPTVPVEPTHKSGGGKVGRRVLLTAAGLAVCGGAVALTPVALEQAAKYTEGQLKAAVATAENNARLAVYKELENLEGVGLDIVIKVAQFTQQLVNYVVVPVFTLLTKIGSGALDILIGAVNTAIAALNLIHVDTSALVALKNTITAWKTNSIDTFSQYFSTYANADLTATETYLLALQARVQAAQTATPVPTPTQGLF